MGCLIVLVGCLAPRLLMFFIFLLTDWFSKAFETTFWPLLGFFFLPYATLAYMAAMLNNNGRLNGFWLALFIVAIILDLSSDGATTSEVTKREDTTGVLS
jgi:hypothetical protein